VDGGESCLGCLIILVIVILVSVILSTFIKDSNIIAWIVIIIIFSLLAIWRNRVYKPTRLHFICPHCFSKHTLFQCGFKTSYQNRTGVPSVCLLSVKTDKNNFILDECIDTCYRCDTCTKHIYCPTYPDKEIPPEYLKLQSFPIALLGAKASGKSNYIGVLVQEIKHKMELPFNCSLTLDNRTASLEAYEQYYYRPLYLGGHTVSATEAGIEIPPLIFPLKFWKTHKDTALTFYDTAGENLDHVDSMQQFTGYISYAQGIILLLDPLQIPDVRDQLTAKGFTGLPELNTEAAKILDAVIQVIRRVSNNRDVIKIPIALVLTKIDVLEQYDILPADSCLRTESAHLQYGRFVQPDFKRTHHEIEALISNWLQGALMSYIRQFGRYAFFGVSALGANPNGATLVTGVNPRRVLDPLLWLLAEDKYIGGC